VSRDKRKDLRLIKPAPPTGAEVDRAAEALRAALAPGELASADHEALLAMVLGDDAAEVAAEERSAANALRRALESGASHPLAELAGALRAAQCLLPAPSSRGRGGELHEDDNEALIAVALGLDAEAREASEPARLREALDGHGRHPLADLALSLSSAHHPADLAVADGEALLSLSLGRSLGTEIAASDDDLREAAGLREALAGRGHHPLAPWAGALRAAAGQHGSIDDLRHERILRRALDGASRPSVVIATIVAMAAAVALFLGAWGERGLEAPDAPVAKRGSETELVVARSTQSLFDPTVPFGARGGESDRMERIVEARAADLRANRFAAWGVR
jgi:hypothetical protein